MWSIIQAAGWPIWPLILASIIALALIFERFWSLRQSVVAPPGMVEQVLAEVRQTGVTPELVGKTAQRGPLGRLLAAGLANIRAPRPVMKEAIEEVGHGVIHDLERFLTSLGTIAAMAPLLGLLGTVMGMIQAFNVIATQGVGTPATLGGGISEALITTAAGLTIAIPVILAHRFLSSRVEQLALEMEEFAVRLVDLLGE